MCGGYGLGFYGYSRQNQFMNDTTSASLLIRLRQPTDREAWSRFVRIYGPLIYKWARRKGLQDDDAADLVQDVMTLLLRKLPVFQYDKSRSFRSWLKTVTINRWRERVRKKVLPVANATESEIANLADPDSDDFWETEYQQEIIGRALKLMKKEFKPATWEACERYVLKDESPDALAKELDISVWTIYSAKSRLLKRLRDELDGMLD